VLGERGDRGACERRGDRLVRFRIGARCGGADELAREWERFRGGEIASLGERDERVRERRRETIERAIDAVAHEHAVLCDRVGIAPGHDDVDVRFPRERRGRERADDVLGARVRVAIETRGSLRDRLRARASRFVRAALFVRGCRGARGELRCDVKRAPAE
jgi:hypothetical protein